MINDTYHKTIIDKATVARLATVDSECKPHLIPVVFVYDDDYYFIPIDQKSKRSKPENLKRIKNIQQNPNVALLIDEYNEEWRKLYFIMIQGKASILGGKESDQNEVALLEKAHELLSGKYVQYQQIGIGEYVIMIVPQKVITWKNV
ncbi:MAG TPA: TIGR03668 family PPOX class F420-dependent oxidoreductase [Candidatus Bathyarchaeia archaeon]|nr:TIGR03668 family PPOX class F420-dependent oxidoreductase [Candidatus Bathyarchaeia archaeon]